MVGQDGGARPLAQLEPAFEWLEAHGEITDVVVSGGDPLIMNEPRLEAILKRLASFPHLGTVRIATRAPVTLPQRIDASLCRVLRVFPATWVMTHFNHPKELTPESTRAIAMLVDHGLPVMNQSVLLRGVNDDVATLTALFKGLVARRARPYYLLQADPVRGTSHLRTPLQRGIELMTELQGRVSGIALPKLVVDTPHGMGKVVVGPNAIVRQSGGVTTLRTFRGEVDYVDPPR
jgi:lysine 2,3-aminomutase